MWTRISKLPELGSGYSVAAQVSKRRRPCRVCTRLGFDVSSAGQISIKAGIQTLGSTAVVASPTSRESIGGLRELSMDEKANVSGIPLALCNWDPSVREARAGSVVFLNKREEKGEAKRPRGEEECLLLQ
jgi:hypothetical protein